MDELTVRAMWQIDHEVLARLSKEWTGHRMGKAAVVKTATLIGRIGRVITGGSKENVVGFLAGRVAPDTIHLDWLAAYPYERLVVLKALIGSLRREFKGFDIVVRVPNDEGKYEFLGDLRDATGVKVEPEPSQQTKVRDWDGSSTAHVYVRLRGEQADTAGRVGDRQAKVVGDTGHRPRSR